MEHPLCHHTSAFDIGVFDIAVSGIHKKYWEITYIVLSHELKPYVLGDWDGIVRRFASEWA